MAKPSDSITRTEVLQRWSESRPAQTSEAALQRWAERVAEELGYRTEAGAEDRSFAEHDTYLFSLRQHAATSSQKTGRCLGATQARALDVFNEAMGAEEVTFLRDRHGDPVLGEDGKPREIRAPLWGIRLKAAENVTKIHGGYAPTQIEVNETIRLEDMTTDQMLEKLSESQRRIAQLTRELTEGTAGAAGTRTGTDGQAISAGQVVLADRVHQNG
jgi:hypothetical protein